MYQLRRVLHQYLISSLCLLGHLLPHHQHVSAVSACVCRSPLLFSCAPPPPLAAFALPLPCSAGGVLVHAQTGSPQAVQLGLGSGALLGMAAVAMSDMRSSDIGELGAKGAWGE